MVCVSVAIPTYQREQVLLETVNCLLQHEPLPSEIIVVDQTRNHDPATERALALLESEGQIRWIRLGHPSITHAMNVGLQEARNEIVLFLDDDIIPGADLISAHARAHENGCDIVAGQVLQPGEEPDGTTTDSDTFRFRSSRSLFISELMGGNFSINRELALKLGGFDENFVRVAYRFEAEFAARALAGGEKIWFEPQASIRHLRVSSGGTRSYGDHLKTIKPSHSVGAYYYLLRSRNVSSRLLNLLSRPLRAVRTKHHATHPWWIPVTLAAEAMGFVWAVCLYLRGPRLLSQSEELGR